MTFRKFFRFSFGVLLAGSAGLSLTSSILPTVLSTLGLVDSFFARWALGDYAAHVTLAWAVTGWVVIRLNNPKLGALVLGLVGLVSGALIGFLSIGKSPQLLLACALPGAIYGGIGGLLIGTVMQERETGPDQ